MQFVYEEALAQFESLDLAQRSLLSKLASERLVLKGQKDLTPMHIRQEVYQMYKEFNGSLVDCINTFILNYFQQNPDIFEKIQQKQRELNLHQK